MSLILKIIKSFKSGNVTVNDVIFTSSLMFRIRKNAFSLTIISIISAITVSVLCFAAISRGSLSKEISLESPYEVTTNNDILSEKLKYQLEQQHIAYNYNYKQVVYTHLYKDYLFDVNAARPYSVTVTNEDYFSNVSLKKDKQI